MEKIIKLANLQIKKNVFFFGITRQEIDDSIMFRMV